MVANNHTRYAIRILVALLLSMMWQESIGCAGEPCISFSNYRTFDTEAWWIPHAMLSNHLHHQELASQVRQGKKINLDDDRFPITGHTLVEGKGDTLILQRFFKGWPGISDTSNLMRITIVTREPLSGVGEIQIGGDSGAMVFFTDGMPSFRDFCVGYALTGNIKYSTYRADTPARNPGDEIFFSRLMGINNGVKAIISMEVSLFDSKNSHEVDCGRCSFSADFVFQASSISSINEKLAR